MREKVVTINNGNNIDLYYVKIEERPYFDREVLSNFVTDLVFSTNSDLKVTRKEYSNAIMGSLLCTFNIQSVIPFTKIYLN